MVTKAVYKISTGLSFEKRTNKTGASLSILEII